MRLHVLSVTIFVNISMLLPLNVVQAGGNYNPLTITSIPREMSYQGVLRDSGGDPVEDSVYNITFRIYNLSSGGSSLWDETLPCTTTAGVFTAVFSSVDLPFDEDYWLELEIDTEILDPRQKMTMVGYSAVSDTADYAQRVATVDGATGGTISGDVSIQSNLSVDGNIDATGKATIGPGHTNTGANAFVAGENNTASGAQSTVSGGIFNTASGQVSAVGGGFSNTAGGSYAVVGGGDVNSAQGDVSAVCGGSANSASGVYSGVFSGTGNLANDSAAVVSGGVNNYAMAKYSFIGGGRQNITSEYHSVVAGGADNVASGAVSFVGGGQEDSATGSHSVVSGGYLNTASGEYSTVAGGQNNVANNNYSTVGGGSGNTAGDSSTVCGGINNSASNEYSSAVCGGVSNEAYRRYSFIGGGFGNHTHWEYSVIGGGLLNYTGGARCVVAGGQDNEASGPIGWAAVVGGLSNTASADYSYVGGGNSNTASGAYSAVAGGANNTASGSYSFAGGRRAKANHGGSFVWADDTDADFASTADDQFLIRATGGVGIGTDNPTSALHVNGEAKCEVGGVEFYMVPQGAIIMWAGTLASIPAGWALCDGTNGTPNLSDRFIYSVHAGENPGSTGGSATIPAHSHSVDIAPFNSAIPNHAWPAANGGLSALPDWNHFHEIDPPLTYTNTQPATSCIPPYYKLAFIMKL